LVRVGEGDVRQVGVELAGLFEHAL
jgi:hypothetical protein